VEAEDKQPEAPVDVMNEEVVDYNVDTNSLSDVNVNKEDLTKNQATILFRGAVVIDNESASDKEEELKDSIHAADEIDEPAELDVHKTAMLDLLEHSQSAGTPLDYFDKLVSKLLEHGKNGFDIQKDSKRKSFI
jgi:hypothetical protein